MADNTKIEWADKTFNPWIGCTRISPACDNCYAARIDHRFGGGHWGAGAPRKRTSPSNWAQPLRWNRQAAERGVRYRVFCASLADVFDNEVPEEWRADLFELIRQTPNLDWLLLTKRIGNVANMLPVPFDFERQYPNVWLGATVVTQAEADRDVPKLLDTPAAVRFLSIEPMLGEINLRRIYAKNPSGFAGTYDSLTGDWHPGDGPVGAKGCVSLDWIIAGGESGPEARPSHPNWFRSLRDQCIDAGVPFLFKQWGEWVSEHHPAGDPETQGTDDQFVDITFDAEGRADDYRGIYMCHVGKKAAGRELDGRTWDQFPQDRGL